MKALYNLSIGLSEYVGYVLSLFCWVNILQDWPLSHAFDSLDALSDLHNLQVEHSLSKVF